MPSECQIAACCRESEVRTNADQFPKTEVTFTKMGAVSLVGATMRIWKRLLHGNSSSGLCGGGLYVDELKCICNKMTSN